jgi:phosphoglycolate phosphatase
MTNPWQQQHLQNRAVIFDLDGTLVDSAPSILASLDHSFSAQNVIPSSALQASIIGPPLQETVQYLAPQLAQDEIKPIIEAFKQHYDTSGYLQTEAFAGAETMLQQLQDARLNLAIVTNKRAKPTRLILQHLGWQNFFAHIYSPDSFSPTVTSKAELIGLLLQHTGWQPVNCLYIGDRLEDWQSAQSNCVRFGWAQWGFSQDDLHFDDDSFVLGKPDPTAILKQLH